MHLHTHPAYAKFVQILTGQERLAAEWQGNAFRFASIHYPHPDQVLSGVGSYKVGGRWNAPLSFHAVYGSTQPAIAVEESNASASAYAATGMLQPRLMVAIRLRLSRVLDLTAAATRRALHVTLIQLREEDWRARQAQGAEALTQALGRAAFDAQFEAMLAPSARVARGVNVVVFPENILAGSEMEIWGADELRALNWVKYR